MNEDIAKDRDDNQDYKRISEGSKSCPVLSGILFPSSLMSLDTGSIGTEETLAVIILAIFLLTLIPVVIWKYIQIKKKLREAYSTDSYISDNFGPKAEQSASGNSGLYARWNGPIMSFEEYKAFMEEGMLEGATIFILLGSMFAFGVSSSLAEGDFKGVMFFLFFWLYMVGLGLLPLFIVKKIARSLKDKDGSVEVKVPLTRTDLSATVVVRKFLVENGYSYEFEEKNNRQRIEKKYLLDCGVMDCGNYINLVFIRMKRNPPTYSGWLEFGYKFSNYVESRKLQRELDEYLTEKGIIKKREASKTRNGGSIRIR